MTIFYYVHYDFCIMVIEHYDPSHLAESLFVRGAGVHEGLGDHGQTRVDDRRLVDVEHKLWVLYYVHPEPQQQAAAQEHSGIQ